MKIKVVCLNLWQGGNLFDGILKFLEAEDADILLLQEVYNASDPKLPTNYRSIDVLRAALDYSHYVFASAILDRFPEAKVQSGNAIFSKFPIVTRDAVFSTSLMENGTHLTQKVFRQHNAIYKKSLLR